VSLPPRGDNVLTIHRVVGEPDRNLRRGNLKYPVAMWAYDSRSDARYLERAAPEEVCFRRRSSMSSMAAAKSRGRSIWYFDAAV
jgi:hypothetical protein